MLFKLIEDPPNDINIICFMNIDQDVIQVNNHKDIELFYEYLIDVSLEAY